MFDGWLSLLLSDTCQYYDVSFLCFWLDLQVKNEGNFYKFRSIFKLNINMNDQKIRKYGIFKQTKIKYVYNYDEI